MTKVKSALLDGGRYVGKQVEDIWDSLFENRLWQRMLKNVIATTILVSIVLIPGSKTAIGKAGYLGAITTVFGHPGRRFGQMTEALILVICGTLLGVGWSMLGLYLGSLLIKENPPAAYTIRGIFLAVAVILHGYLRSKTPRLFIFVLLMIITSVVSLTSTATAITKVAATQLLYPILLAAGIIPVVNLCIFPEFSSGFLGQKTIETLNDTANALKSAGHYFIDLELKIRSGPQTDSREVLPAEEQASAGGYIDEKKKASYGPKIVSLHAKISRFLSKCIHSSDSRRSKERVSEQKGAVSLTDLTAAKAQIRKKLEDCKAAQRECNFELAFSVLPPRDMKPISDRAMKKLVANTIAIIGACESKYALLGEDSVESQPVGVKPDNDYGDGQATSELARGTPPPRPSLQNRFDGAGSQRAAEIEWGRDQAELEAIKPKREIEFGDAKLLQYLLGKISRPYMDLQDVIDRMVEAISACLAYVYDVPTLPSGSKAPCGIMIEELDVYLELLAAALTRFDTDTASALEGAAAMQDIQGLEPDIMPREEVFLISSFILNLRQTATHLEDMLKHSRDLVTKRQQRNGRHRLYAPHIKWSNWLYSGGEEAEALPPSGSRAKRQGNVDDTMDDGGDAHSLDSRKKLLAQKKREDLEEQAAPAVTEPASKRDLQDALKATLPREHGAENGVVPISLRLRGRAADMIEWIQESEDLLYATKLAVAVFLVLWPAFIHKFNSWFSLNRGLWAALQLILITEVSIGTSVMTFILRGIGTTLGCLWGWASLEAHNNNRIVCAVMVCIGLLPCTYVQLGTKYPKAGMVSIVSICVVALSTQLETVPGTSTENFLKRWIAFLIGGTVALAVEMVLLPVKARTRLVESLCATLVHINDMEKCIASGIESGTNIDVYSAAIYLRFESSSAKANGALTAAETFLPFCSNEPRIKGSFEGLALVYDEIVFVLHQIMQVMHLRGDLAMTDNHHRDRMTNMLTLRTAYGSGPLEELNADIYPYRRNVAGSVTLTLFAIHSALSTKLSLPQFLPSARLAHLRMINRVREVVREKVNAGQESDESTTKRLRQRAVRRKYMSWNAASAAQAEIIEFLEELIELTKLLVGANEFRSGLLTRPMHDDSHSGQNVDGGMDVSHDIAEVTLDAFDQSPARVAGAGTRRRGATVSSSAEVEASGLTRRRRGTTLSSRGGVDEIPASLKRIQTRKLEAGIRRQKTNEAQHD